MKVGLIGYNSAGKSTLYRAASLGQAKGEITAVPVPDPRFDAIVKQVKPKKITPATVVLHDDLEDASGSGKTFSVKFLEAARKMDLFLHVVRAFESNPVAYFTDVAPLRDEENIGVELILADLQMVETRLERLQKAPGAKGPGSLEYIEKMVLERFKPQLETGVPIRAMELDEDAENLCKNYQFLSAKPMVVAFNTSEEAVTTIPGDIQTRIEALAKVNTPAFVVSAPIEDEIAQLDPADQPEFLASLGLSEPAGAKVIRAVYEALGLITFFTAGENETRAWPLRVGSTSVKAAATIHTDIAKGFIRSETVSYADYEAAGSLDAAYSSGKMRLEGKECEVTTAFWIFVPVVCSGESAEHKASPPVSLGEELASLQTPKSRQTAT
jgi:GTP-binding protein YchF